MANVNEKTGYETIRSHMDPNTDSLVSAVSKEHGAEVSLSDIAGRATMITAFNGSKTPARQLDAAMSLQTAMNINSTDVTGGVDQASNDIPSGLAGGKSHQLATQIG